MAVGDVVNGVSASNTTLYFQPAAGTASLVTSVYMDSTGTGFGLYDGANDSFFYTSDSQYASSIGNLKVFINNSIYLYIPPGGAGKYLGYTGIQIK